MFLSWIDKILQVFFLSPFLYIAAIIFHTIKNILRTINEAGLFVFSFIRQYYSFDPVLLSFAALCYSLSSIILPLKEFMIFHKINANYFRLDGNFRRQRSFALRSFFSFRSNNWMFVVFRRPSVDDDNDDFIIGSNDFYWKLHRWDAGFPFSCGSIAIPNWQTEWKYAFKRCKYNKRKRW